MIEAIFNQSESFYKFAEKFLCKIFLGPTPEVEIKSSQKISQKAATEVFN